MPCMHQRSKSTRLSKIWQPGKDHLSYICGGINNKKLIYKMTFELAALEAKGGLRTWVTGSTLTWIQITLLLLSRRFTSTLQCKVRKQLVQSLIAFKLLLLPPAKQTNTVIKTLAQSHFDSLFILIVGRIVSLVCFFYFRISECNSWREVWGKMLR